jgi:hypothetical protein
MALKEKSTEHRDNFCRLTKFLSCSCETFHGATSSIWGQPPESAVQGEIKKNPAVAAAGL